MTATVALVVAAGKGERLGSDGPKAFVVLGGRPMLRWSLEVLRATVDDVVVALPADTPFAADGVRTVPGGAERSHSVRNALAAAPAQAELVLVHDAARPLLTAAIVADCLAAMEDPSVDAAIAAAAVTDTVKEADRVDGQVRVAGTLDRSRLWAVQTPQVFRRSVLERVLAQPDAVLAAATDDASLVEAAGGTVVLVPSPRTNLKVTTPEDLQLAELLLTAREAATP
ncbi:2-C-methyl-D-erythritol 4-phosphate cytidylyltransferase [Paraconexibacter algicola]|uniref:2-C-methyl-D-erythritol 4-phosphate cytidylyltransferase n=2 Tax=Solirubrobacterales TaxID=588673 RepID=A0A2T4UFD7_9ACTN|nr:2-C-methyl-D-erythritol 4-phosphate cytidylyltransferase [Paraconexibacter algicola]PTL56503.1 2-C-methyl-D-erythritol 4-phosphate cytidylyltransferase [Paraconexibacter algicola]